MDDDPMLPGGDPASSAGSIDGSAASEADVPVETAEGAAGGDAAMAADAGMAADAAIAGEVAAPETGAARSDVAATADELAAMAAAVEAARPLARPLEPGADGAETATPDGAPPVATGVRRARVGGILLRLGAALLTFGLFVGGLAMDVSVYQRTQSPPPAVGDVSTGGIATPPVVSELTDALAKNDADALRSAVAADPYRLLAGELQRRNIQGVTSVETLATMQDGPRSATEIVINGRTTAGVPITINLVVHVTDNQIVNFR